MSAYICGKDHIIYLVTAAMSSELNRHNGPFHWKNGELSGADFDEGARIANLLWRENIKSVAYRYRGSDEYNEENLKVLAETLVIKPDDLLYLGVIDPTQVLKSINCYVYQSCEHPEWDQPENSARSFCESLEDAAISCLPGYDNAEWGSPKSAYIGAARN